MRFVKFFTAMLIIALSGTCTAKAASKVDILNFSINNCSQHFDLEKNSEFQGMSDAQKVELIYPLIGFLVDSSQDALEKDIQNMPAEFACLAQQVLKIKRNNGMIPSSTNGSPSSTIDDCTQEIQSKQTESLSWSGDVNDIATRLGQFQKDLFEGRCAGHPEAQAYVNGANRMLGYSAGSGSAADNQAGSKTGKRSNVPEANASHCLSPQKEGGVINKCNYAIEYSYCVVQPKPGSWSASFDCNQGKSGSWQVGANSRAIMHTSGSQVAFFGCKYGPTLSKPDGISPADFKYNANGMPTGRCREWGSL